MTTEELIEELKTRFDLLIVVGGTELDSNDEDCTMGFHTIFSGHPELLLDTINDLKTEFLEGLDNDREEV